MEVTVVSNEINGWWELKKKAKGAVLYGQIDPFGLNAEAKQTG